MAVMRFMADGWRTLALSCWLALVVLAPAVAGAAGIRVMEPLTVRLTGGCEIRLAPGAEYPLTGLDANGCRIAYPAAPGITVEVTVPRNKVQILERTGAEIAESARRKEQAEFAAAQRARGLVAVGGAWLTAAQAAAITAVQQLAAAGPGLEGRRRTAAECEQERAAAAGELTDLVAALAAQEKQLHAERQQLEADKAALNRSASSQVARYNARVMDHNRRAGRQAEMLKRQQALHPDHAGKQPPPPPAREAYGREEQAVATLAQTVREQFLTATQQADDRQWAVLRPYGLWLARLAEAAAGGPAGPGLATSQGVWVTGTVNNDLKLRFLVDTGASWVTLSDTQFLRLGVPLPAAAPIAVLRLANGQEAHGRRVILQSVRIGALELTGVGAVVLPDHPGFCPLLGMSFLERCRWHRGASGALVFDAP